jgi:glucosamine-6-phosphate deaminase
VTINVFNDADAVADALAHRVADAIRQKPTLVLGLPTGRTPVRLYERLRERHASGALDPSQIETFNLDEFVGITPSHPGSFRTFMETHLFNAWRLQPDQIHFLDGSAADLDAECSRYEAAIDEAGGLDLQIVGIGANGHIGFNEPADALQARTHRVTLAASTRRDNAALFGGEWEQVPRQALSMGMGTILRASALILLATGERKAQCIEHAVHGPLTPRLPASFLQVHARLELYLDRAAAALLREG